MQSFSDFGFDQQHDGGNGHADRNHHLFDDQRGLPDYGCRVFERHHRDHCGLR
jgi:hypothetical protein